jgi:hypothetical protein
LTKLRCEKKRVKREIVEARKTAWKKVQDDRPGFSPVRQKPAVKVKARQDAELTQPPQQVAKVPSQGTLAVLARRFKLLDSVGYERAKNPASDATVLAIDAANGALKKALGKYRGFNPLQLMEAVIVDYIRVEQPPAKETKRRERKERKPKRSLTERQRAAQLAATQPVVRAVTAKTRKGAPKTVPPRFKRRDPQVVQDALDALFQGDGGLKAMFCDISLEEAKRLLRTNPTTVQLAFEVKEELACPTRVYNYLDTAVRVLLPRYRDEQLEAEMKAMVEAEERRRERVAEAREAAEKREQQRRRQAQYLVPFSMRSS